MESSRGKTLVMHEMNKPGLQNISVESGKDKFNVNILNENLELFDSTLNGLALELLLKQRRMLIVEIKEAVYQLVYLTDDLPKQNNSSYISEKINVSYSSLENIFSSLGIGTLEKYVLLQQIERVKELLIYSDINLSEIASKMHYSSETHLSDHFKRNTGLTPCFYRKNRNKLN